MSKNAKINTGTVTIFRNYNHGAALQAYALQQFLVQNSIENELISYKRVDGQGYVLGYGVKSRKVLESLLRRVQFKRFISEHLKVSKPMSGNAAFAEYAENFAVLLAGSDQIWKVNSKGVLDSTFFLETSQGFTGRKISYAASASGIESFGSHAEKVRELLSQFQTITVRDPHTAMVVNNNHVSVDHVVVDPTVLIDFEALIRGNEGTSEPYLASYFLSHQKWFAQYCREIEDAAGLKFKHLDASFDGDKKCFGFGPVQWLNTIRQAEAIFTNSFHGLLFGIKFEKPVFLFQRSGVENRKLTAFLDTLGVPLEVVLADGGPTWKDKEALRDAAVKAKAVLADKAKTSASVLLDAIRRVEG